MDASENGSRGRPAWVYVPLALAFVSLALFEVRTLTRPDLWMHLAAGRTVAEAGVPHADAYSFTAEQNPWVDNSWLYDRVLYGLWQAGGAPAVSLLHILAVLAAFGLLAAVARSWSHPLGLAGALLLCVWLLAPAPAVAPAVLALLFPALYLWVLTGRRRPWVVWTVLLPAQLLWANMHQSFLLGPAIVALAAVERLLVRRGSGEGLLPDEQRELRWLGVATVALLAISLLNPYGVGLYRHVLTAWRDPADRLFQLWVSPMRPLFAETWTRHLITATLLIGAAGLVTQKGRLPVTLTALAVLGAFLVIRSVHLIALFAVLAFPFLALSLRATTQAVAEFFRPRLQGGGRRPVAIAAGVLTVLAVLTAGAAVSGRYYRASGSASVFGFGAEERLYPKAALDLVSRPGFPARMLNLPFDGGYLVWNLPERKVFTDDRAPVYGVDFYSLLGRLLSGDAAAQHAVTQRWKIDAVLLNCCWPGAPAALRSFLDGGTWALVYFDGSSAVLLRRQAAFADLLALAPRERPGFSVLEDEVRQTEAALAGGRGTGLSPRLFGAANAFFALDRVADAAPLYKLVLQTAPGAVGCRLRLGVCEARLGRWESAAHELGRVTDSAPRNPQAWYWLAQVYKQLGRDADARRATARFKRLAPGSTDEETPGTTPAGGTTNKTPAAATNLPGLPTPTGVPALPR